MLLRGRDDMDVYDGRLTTLPVWKKRVSRVAVGTRDGRR